jgi:predicted porin
VKQKTILACAVLVCLGGSAWAQSSVTLYGVLDAGVERISNVSGTTASVTRMPGQSGGSLPSRWGIRGSEDLGNGLKTVFTLESGISVDKGSNNTNQGGRLFGRQAFVGLAGDWGQLSFGRQYTMYFWSLLDGDLLGPSIYALGSLDAGIPGARSDNTVAYKGTFSGVTLGATYSLGRDTTNCAGELAGDAKACREVSLLAKYDDKDKRWGVALAHDAQRGGTGGTGGLTLSSQTDKRTVVDGYAKWGDLKVAAGLIKRNNQGVVTTTVTPKSDLAYLEAGYALTSAFTVEGLWGRLKYKDSTDNSKATLTSVRGLYALSKRTVAYVAAGRMSNKGSANLGVSGGTTPADGASTAPGAGKGQSGLMIGMRHSF